MIIFLAGIFCPVLVETPRDTSNGNGVVTESSNSALGMHWLNLQVNVNKYYSQEPAPMGIADFGICSSGPYEYATNDFVGIATIRSLSTNGSSRESGMMSLQFNVNFAFNTSLGQYVYEIQDTANINSMVQGRYVDFSDNVWNVSAPSANMSASGISGNGQIFPIEFPGQRASFYACVASQGYPTPPGDAIYLTYPVTITFNVTSTVSSSGEPTVNIAYDDGYGLITYDTVTFTNVTGFTSLAGFEVNGFNLNPNGGYYDSELILAGPGGGLDVTDIQSDVQLQLEYWNGHNYELVPSAYNFGSDTAEGLDNVLSGFSHYLENGTMFAEIASGAGQLGELYDESQIGMINITSPLTLGTLYVTNASDSNASAWQIPFVDEDVTVALYPGFYDLQLYNQYGQLFDEGNFTVSAGQILHLQTPLSPATHNVAVTNAQSTKSVIGKGFGDNVTVLVSDTGDYDETFNVTAYANSTVIGTEQVSLNSTEQTTLTFTWNTTDSAYGNYTLSGYAWPVPGETNTADNNFTGGSIAVSIPGDLDGSFKVSRQDLVILTNAYSSKPGDSNWNPNADINGDGKVSLQDLVILTEHYGQHSL
jgi:hypothetical protein